MKSLIVEIKKVIPYLLLIALYFFFINIEARKGMKKNELIDTKNLINKNKLDNINNTNQIAIPVIPFNQ